MYKTSFASAIMAASVAGNSTPIFGTYPGWLEGTDQKGIQIELFEDYLCSDCKTFNTVFEEVLAQPWLDGTVADQVGVGVTTFPLPYHVHSFQVNQLVPYFLALCTEGGGCYEKEYKDFAFKNQETILDMKDYSLNEFTAWWSGQVATEFNLSVIDVALNYSNDPYDTNWNTRVFWKYGTAKQVSGTPTAFLNGAKLDSVPMTVDGWMDLLNDTYNSQYGVITPTKPKYPQN